MTRRADNRAVSKASKPGRALAFLCLLAWGARVLASQPAVPYGQARRVIRCGILASAVETERLSLIVFYILGSDEVTVRAGLPLNVEFPFQPPKPAGWEFVNPVASPVLPKSDPNYWTSGISFSALDEAVLGNFDVLLLCVWPGFSLDRTQARLLASWVEQGGLLWIDNQSGATGASLNLWMEPVPIAFAARGAGPALKSAADLNHGLLKGIFTLGQQEIDLLGIQQSYVAGTGPVSPLSGITSGVGAGDRVAGTPQLLLQDVVTEGIVGGSPLPSIAAGRFGRGAVVATSCGVAQAISAWYDNLLAGTVAELPQWAVPDMKLAYNMIAWAHSWSNPQGDARGQNQQSGDLGAPLSEMWRLEWLMTGQRVIGPLTAPVLGSGLALTGDGGGLVHTLDLRPERDLDGDGKPEDGVRDLSEGTWRDEVWASAVEGALGTGLWLPVGAAGGEFFDSAAGAPRSMVAVAASEPREIGAGGYLVAYRSDPMDAGAGTPLWPQPAAVSGVGVTPTIGRVQSGPVHADGMFILATTDSTDNPEIPTRDAHLLAYDVLGPFPGTVSDPRQQPTVAIPLSAGGTGIEVFSPPSVAFLPLADAQTGEVEPVQTAVLAGNALPRIGASATGRIVVAPLMIRFAAPGWDQSWLSSQTGDDVASNQAVKVYVRDATGQWVQVPPHQDDDSAKPLNYVRRFRAGQIEIFFTRWNLFSHGRQFTGAQTALPVGFAGFQAKYLDNNGTERTVTAQPQPASTTAINAVIKPGPNHSPCLVGDTVYLGGSSVEAYPNRSIPGTVWAARLSLQDQPRVAWQFFGDQTGGPLRQTGQEFFSDFPVAAAAENGTLYVAGNYEFMMDTATLEITRPMGGLVGVLYALDLKASNSLLYAGDPVLPGGIAPQAPLGQSADPNQAALLQNTRGTVVWITRNLNPNDNNPQDAIPQRTGVMANWTVDFMNGIIRLGPGALGKYGGQLLRVRYFRADTFAPDERIVRAESLVKWAFYFAGVNLGTGENTGNWAAVSAPVVSNGTVHVAVYGGGGTYICSFAEASTGQSPPNPVWTPAGVAAPEPLVNLAADGDSLFASVSGAGGQVGGRAALVAFSNAATVVADSTRVVEVKSENVGSRLPDLTRYAFAPGTAPPRQGSLPPFTCFFHQNPDPVIPGARQLAQRVPNDYALDLTQSGGPVLLGTFVTEMGKPNAASIRPGTWRFVFTAAAPSGGRIWVNVYARDTGGGLVALWTPQWNDAAPPGVPVPPTMGDVALDVPLPGFTLDAADRVQVEVWTYSAAGSVTLRLEGDGAARMETPIAGSPNSARVNRIAASVAEFSPGTSAGLLGTVPLMDSYPDRQLKGFSHPSRARKLPDGNVLVCDTGNNRVVEIDNTGQVVWQYPDSDIANTGIAQQYRTPTPAPQRLRAPMDAKRYRTRTTEIVAGAQRTIDWVTTLIADSGSSRLVEVVRPLVDGLYRPDLLAQTVSIYGPSIGVSRPYYVSESGTLMAEPTGMGADTAFTMQAPAGARTLIASFITQEGHPGLAVIPEGVWAFLLTARAAPSNPAVQTRILVRIWRADASGGNLGVITETALSPPLSVQPDRVALTAAQSSPLVVRGDRIAVEVHADVIGPSGTYANVSVYSGISYRSRAYIPFGQTGAPLMITCADRAIEPERATSTIVWAGLGSHPTDPTTSLWQAAGDGTTRIVSLGVAPAEPFQDANGSGWWDAGETFTDLNGNGRWDAAQGGILARYDGVNLFKPRVDVPSDFAHVRQADRIVSWVSDLGKRYERVLVVDDVGVKCFDTGGTAVSSFGADMWYEPPVTTAFFEMSAADYAPEVAKVRSVYPDLGWAQHDGFFPASAQLLPDGRFLIANCQARPALGAGEPTSAMVPLKSEVIEVDPTEPIGSRIVRRDGSYFIVPDPFSLAYPGIEGMRSGLSQPIGVSR